MIGEEEAGGGGAMVLQDHGQILSTFLVLEE